MSCHPILLGLFGMEKMHLDKYKYSDQVGLLDGSFYCSKITAIKLPKITELGAKLAAASKVGTIWKYIKSAGRPLRLMLHCCQVICCRDFRLRVTNMHTQFRITCQAILTRCGRKICHWNLSMSRIQIKVWPLKSRQSGQYQSKHYRVGKYSYNALDTYN